MSSDEPVQELNRDECRELLKHGTLGRLATAVGGVRFEGALLVLASDPHRVGGAPVDRRVGWRRC